MRYLKIPALEFIPAMTVMAICGFLFAVLPGWGMWTPIPIAVYAYVCIQWRGWGNSNPILLPLPARKKQ